MLAHVFLVGGASEAGAGACAGGEAAAAGSVNGINGRRALTYVMALFLRSPESLGLIERMARGTAGG